MCLRIPQRVLVSYFGTLKAKPEDCNDVLSLQLGSNKPSFQSGLISELIANAKVENLAPVFEVEGGREERRIKVWLAHIAIAVVGVDIENIRDIVGSAQQKLPGKAVVTFTNDLSTRGAIGDVSICHAETDASIGRDWDIEEPEVFDKVEHGGFGIKASTAVGDKFTHTDPLISHVTAYQHTGVQVGDVRAIDGEAFMGINV